MLCTSRFVDDVMFPHNRPYGTWRWQDRHWQCCEASSQNFQCFLPDGTTYWV